MGLFFAPELFLVTNCKDLNFETKAADRRSGSTISSLEHE